jgi:hypothetical protein
MQSKNTMLIPTPKEPLFFKPIRERIKTSQNSKNKSGFNYTMQIDTQSTKSHLIELINKIPTQPGYLILFASNDNITFKPIKKYYSNENLRILFFENSSKLYLCQNLINIITLNNYKSLKFQIYERK